MFRHAEDLENRVVGAELEDRAEGARTEPADGVLKLLAQVRDRELSQVSTSGRGRIQRAAAGEAFERLSGLNPVAKLKGLLFGSGYEQAQSDRVRLGHGGCDRNQKAGHRQKQTRRSHPWRCCSHT